MTPTTFGASKGQNEKGNQTMNKLHINKKPLLLGLSCKRKITAGIMAAILTLLAGPAFAFSDVFFKSGTTLDDYDFGTVHGQYIGRQPAFVVIEGFTMRPGDTVGWHYHKGQSYVLLTIGTVTEQDYVDGQCTSRQDTAGSAFVEPPGQVHNVTNNGPGVAIIWWATIFPQGDGIQSDGTYYVDSPCN